MPVYTYTCSNGHKHDLLVDISEDARWSVCRTCGLVGTKDGAYLTGYEVDGNRRDSVSGSLDAMRPEERFLHQQQARDIEKAHASGTLLNYKRGKKTPMDLQPRIDKALPNT